MKSLLARSAVTHRPQIKDDPRLSSCNFPLDPPHGQASHGKWLSNCSSGPGGGQVAPPDAKPGAIFHSQFQLYKLAVYVWDEVHWDKRKECAPAKGGGPSITECISGPARMTSVSGLGCSEEVGRSRDS
ncbi:hypothetical protein C0Q70_11810 [Pomacea canaliculata]|uniref:Uncharacterized protein n=1 Tax=Pomacea canaliculata TaxID=400727 RepID=A0A2T7P743_POMCA|nr:hypothetical protein C0Q70_11810 [Pomacea canaliculata]